MNRHLSANTPSISGGSSFKAKGWVAFATLLILSSLLTYAAARPASTLAAAGVAD